MRVDLGMILIGSDGEPEDPPPCADFVTLYALPPDCLLCH